jgi:hypothetical protein
LIDRYGISPIVGALAIVQPMTLALLIVAAHADVSELVLCSTGALFGATSVPLFAANQALMTSLAQPRGLSQTAFALEAVLQELVFLGGPILVAVLASTASPTAALAACGVLSFVGGLSFALTKVARAFRSEAPEHQRAIGALSSPGVRTFGIVGIATGFVFGTLEVAMPGFAGEHGSPSTGGLLLGTIALGSMVGGVWHGSRRAGSQRDRYLVYLALFALALLPLALVAGFFVAPSFATELALVGELAPAGKTTEAFTWVTLAVVIGISCGNAAAGGLVQHGSVTAALLAASGSAAIGAVAGFARRETLALH